MTKKIAICILFAIISLACMNNKKNEPFKTLLVKGKNPTIKHKTLTIEPENLFVHDKPWNNGDMNIQLQMEVQEGEQKYATYLSHSYTDDNQDKYNYPMAFGEYSFALEIEGDSVQLVVEKLDFGKAFYLEVKESASIGNLTILFASWEGEWSVDPNGNWLDTFNTYYIVLKKGSAEEQISIMSLNKYEGNEFSTKWEGYKILVSEDSENKLKLTIDK